MATWQKVSAGVLTLSLAGLGAISSWEGQKTTAYPDVAGVETICTGHTRGVFKGQHATLAQCQQWLKEDSSYAGQAVARCTKAPITQQQYDALVSFVFNVGARAYCASTLAHKINEGDCHGAAQQFVRWDKADGVPSLGLARRRADERQRFEADC